MRSLGRHLQPLLRLLGSRQAQLGSFLQPLALPFPPRSNPSEPHHNQVFLFCIESIQGISAVAHESEDLGNHTIVGKALSNKQIIRKALEHVCLAGLVNKKAQEECLQELDQSAALHYVILLRDTNNLKFRALYSFDFDTNKGTKLYGVGPAGFSPEQILSLHKFSSAAKDFQPLSSVSFSVRVDAITLPWKPKDKSFVSVS
eukprot:m.619512 g.619512  ORF g.619512 m.619512 type:complete len:202 (+) comp58202_c0_seq2:2721-3326(+)